MLPTVVLALTLAICAAAVQPDPGFDLLRVSTRDALAAPLRAVGQLSNGCTGYLIGPCHVVTVAHCVYEPWRNIWWSGLDFHPGRNVGAKGASWSPLGVAPKHDVRFHPNWTSTAAASASDAAIIITSTPIGRKVGWFRHRPPPSAQQLLPVRQEAQGKGLSAGSLASGIAAQQLTLHIAGYPDNRGNGSMWEQCCSALDWQLQGNLLWHDCYARGGNSGSPVWVVWPPQQQQGSDSKMPGAPAELDWERVQAVGVHSSSLKFPKDSQVAVFAQELYAQGIAKAQQQQAAAAGQPAARCSAVTSSLQLAARGSAGLQVGAAPTTAPANAARSSTAAAGAGPAASASLRGVSAAAAKPQGVHAAVSQSSGQRGETGRHRMLLAGAGGRESDGEHTLLPVAVPFYGDNAQWIEQVLQEFADCPGE